MAAIDKIYGNINQKIELENWCSINYPKSLDYFYLWEDNYFLDNKNHCIANFPEMIDNYILKNCSIKWVIDYIKDQYGLK